MTIRLDGPSDGEGEASAIELAVASLLAESHLLRDDALPALAQRHVHAFGGTHVGIYLADLQQTVLVPFLGVEGPADPDSANPLSIDATLAGRAYQHLQIELHSDPHDATAWVPLARRLGTAGVLAVTLTDSATAGPLDDTTHTAAGACSPPCPPS